MAMLSVSAAVNNLPSMYSRNTPMRRPSSFVGRVNSAKDRFVARPTANAVSSSFASKPWITSRILATSSTPRHIGPTRSFMNDAGTMPERLTSSCVGASPTTLLFLAGLRTEGPDSSPMAQTTRFAATAEPEPPLERPGLRSVS